MFAFMIGFFFGNERELGPKLSFPAGHHNCGHTVAQQVNRRSRHIEERFNPEHHGYAFNR